MIGCFVVSTGILSAFVWKEPLWYLLVIVGLFLVLRALNQKSFRLHITNKVLWQYVLYIFSGLIVEAFRLLTKSWEYVGVYEEIYFLALILLIGYPAMFLYLKESVDYLTKNFSLTTAILFTAAIAFVWGEVLNSVAPLWIPSVAWRSWIIVIFAVGYLFETIVAVKAAQVKY